MFEDDFPVKTAAPSREIVGDADLGDFSLSKSVLMDKSAAPPEMVVVAQLVEPRIVIPVVAGSSPVDHPIFPIGTSAEVWKGGKEP